MHLSLCRRLEGSLLQNIPISTESSGVLIFHTFSNESSSQVVTLFLQVKRVKFLQIERHTVAVVLMNEFISLTSYRWLESCTTAKTMVHCLLPYMKKCTETCRKAPLFHDNKS